MIEGLKIAVKEIKGPLPCSDADYNRLKKGRFDLPPATRVLEFFHSMARGWLSAGAARNRVSLKNVPWTPREDTYLLTVAGELPLDVIAQRMCRSRNSVRSRLGKVYRIESRHNLGYFSAADLAKEFGCPYHRVKTALHEGRITGFYDPVRHRWQVDLADLDKETIALLKAPKTHSHKYSETDLGDYYQRYGLKRTLVNGRVKVVKK